MYSATASCHGRSVIPSAARGGVGQDGVQGRFRRSRPVGAEDRRDGQVRLPCQTHDFAARSVAGAEPGVGQVVDAELAGGSQPDDGLRQVGRVGRVAELVRGDPERAVFSAPARILVTKLFLRGPKSHATRQM